VFQIKDGKGNPVYEGKKEREGRYYFSAHDSGTYSFCFGNKMSTVTTKTISMSLSIGKSEEENNPLEGGPKFFS